jgi:hypothetical protein
MHEIEEEVILKYLKKINYCIVELLENKTGERLHYEIDHDILLFFSDYNTQSWIYEFTEEQGMNVVLLLWYKLESNRIMIKNEFHTEDLFKVKEILDIINYFKAINVNSYRVEAEFASIGECTAFEYEIKLSDPNVLNGNDENFNKFIYKTFELYNI